MKKLLASLATIGILAVPLAGVLAIEMTSQCIISHNLDDYKDCDGLEGDTITDPLLSHCCLVDKILTIGDWIFTAILVVAIIIILLAAFQFLTSSGDPDKIKSARNYLIYALIGVAVAFLAKVLVRVVASIMT